MTLFVYVTEQCRADARAHTIADDVERVRLNIEERQSLSTFDQFPPPYLVKKKLHGRQKRLVAETRRVGEHTVVVFLSVMIRGGRDYENEFCRDPVAYGTQHFDGLVENAELERFVAARTAEEAPPGKPSASAAEYELLYNTFSREHALAPSGDAAHDALDRIVCETPMWVRQAAQPHIQGQLNRLAACCVDALSIEPGLHFIEAKEKRGWGVWACRHEGHVLLIQVVDGTNGESAKVEAQQLAALVAERGSEALLQASRRAYPAAVLTDEQLWLDLERETLANMALSPEETEVLASARHAERPFPLFINGRAGSGKSTILQYLFADILHAYGRIVRIGTDGSPLGAGDPGTPLYLTANGELLRVARQFVERLLRSEYHFAQDGGEPEARDEEALTGLLQKAFREFRPFMLELVASENRTRFASARRVDYPRFRRLWEQRFGKDPKARRDHGPDVAWHVIRSYIKGMGSEDYLTPEDYAQLPENQLTVSLQTFTTVHDQVWSSWYQPLNEDGDWDDQDLARYILDNERAPRSYCAVFCDEAQDFTRVELEVLLRLSLYSDRSLSSSDVSRVPFAFAGDEFQTLNPTGFRWDAVKASFVEKFIFELDPSRRGEKADLNYRELRFNYRSASPIVKLSNLVQALRAAKFGIAELKPQRSWLLESSQSPVLHFRADDAQFWAAFRELAAGYVIIVPCDEGEEAEFVARDPILSQHIDQVDGLPKNVLSAGRAKGCEYEAVVVYGFGAATEFDLMSTVGSQSGMPQETRQSLSMQYFVNRVYVAVSRAKRRLIVVDSDEGASRLWKAARDEFARERLIGALKRGVEIWGREVGGSSPGKPADLTSESVPDRLENAKTFYNDGQARRDSYLMMQAAGLYREANDLARWRECRSRALDYEEKWLEAGVAYAEAGFLDDARRCLWRAERPGWLKLRELSGEHPELLSHIELHWARAILEKPSGQLAGEVLERLRDRMKQDSTFALASCTESSWQQAVDTLLRRLLQSGDPLRPAVAKGVLLTLDQVAGQGLTVSGDIIADLAFRGEEFERAAVYWESVGEKRSQRYLQAKSRTSAYPECIEFLHRLGDEHAIVSAFDAHPEVPLESPQVGLVIAALLAAARPHDALRLANRSTSGSGAFAVALYSKEAGDETLATTAILAGFRHHVARGDWDIIVRFINNGDVTAYDPARRDRGVKAWLKGVAPNVRLELIRALARSEKLPEASQHVEQVISRFLRDQLRVKGGEWQSKLTYQEAGAAHERTLRITDALQFYEASITEPLGGEELRHVRMRWLVVKGRQLDYERSRPKPDAATVKRIEGELQKNIHAWQIPSSTVQQLSRFPELDDISEGAGPRVLAPDQRPGMQITAALSPVAEAVHATAPLSTNALASSITRMAPRSTETEEQADASRGIGPPPSTETEDLEIALGLLRIETRSGAQVCLLTHTKSLDSVKLDWGKQRISGTVELTSGEAGNWQVPDWFLHIEMPPTGDILVRLVHRPSRVSVQIAR